MDYVSMCYVRHGGKLFSRGEIINGLTEDEAERLLRKGAIQPAAAGAEETPSLPDTPAAPEEAEPMEEGEEAELPPELDVMDAIAEAPAEEAPKPKKTRSRKGAKTE